VPDSLFKKAENITELNIGSTGGIQVFTIPRLNPKTFDTETTNKFKELSPKIGLLKNLRVVDLSWNDFVILPNEFYTLHRLEELELSFNYNFDLQGERSKIALLKKLKGLYLVGIKFNSFPEELLRLDLESLQLGNFNLRVDEAFIQRISSFVNLKELYLTDVNMDELPHNLDKLPALEKLDIRYSSLKEVRGVINSLKKLKQLKVIYLSGLPLPLEEVNLLLDVLPGVTVISD